MTQNALPENMNWPIKSTQIEIFKCAKSFKIAQIGIVSTVSK
jgi:hypothetical protein